MYSEIKIKTVFIGISAYNEEQNIGNLLESILKQNKNNFRLEQIIIICDGCSDNTAKIINKYVNKYEFVKLIIDEKRLGQGARLNQLFKMCQSDIFITFDADTTLANSNTIAEIIEAFRNKSIGLVGGNNIPADPKTFIEKIIATYEDFWSEVTKHINNGDNIHNCPGCIWAGKKELIQAIILPKDIVANDHFVFLKAMELGYLFKFASKALLQYKLPNNLKDYFSQYGRFLNSRNNIKDYFGTGCNIHYKIPMTVKLKAYLYTFYRKPLFLILAIYLQFLERVINTNNKRYKNVAWSQIASSK